MSRPRVTLGIRAQLLLVLTVFLAIPWLGYEYVRELERFLRDAQERTLAGTAQAVATALHDRPRLFQEGALSPEIEQIIRGLSRTTARISVVDREQNVVARAGSLKRADPQPVDAGIAGDSRVARGWAWLERVALQPLYARVLPPPSEDFSEEPNMPARRPTADGKAIIVAAANPIWVGDEVKGAVVVEQTTNAVLAERNRAFARLFTIVLAALLIGSVALTLYASWLSTRIRRLRDEAEAAIDAHGRVRGVLAGSQAGDEIGDLSRSFSSALARLAQYASHQEAMASRLSHELRTPIAVVRSSLDNLALQNLTEEARVVMGRAQEGLDRLAHIITRMTEATRLESSLAEAEPERFDLAQVVAGCVEGYRAAYPQQKIELESPSGSVPFDGAPELIAQMFDKLIANAVEFARPGTAIEVKLEREVASVRLAVSNEGPRLPAGMEARLFDSMVSVREERSAATPHLGLGLYIVRLIAEHHGGRALAANRADAEGVTVSVVLPLVRALR